MIPRTTRYNNMSKASLKSNPKNKSISKYSILYLRNFATNLNTILLRGFCSFVLPSDFKALLLWMLSSLFF